MNLADALHLVGQDSMKAAQLTDLCIGTVTATGPLEIKTVNAMAPLRAPVLYLTDSVVEKKIPILEHTHAGVHGETGPALLKAEIICKEHGQSLPVKDGYIILNEALKVGDRVLMLRVKSGQKFVVLSRVFEGE